MRKNIFIIGMICCIAFMNGCIGGGNKVTVSKWKFSMNLPSGWVVDSRDNKAFYDKSNENENFGDVARYPLDGKSLSRFVDLSISQEKVGEEFAAKFGTVLKTEVVSRKKTQVNGRETIYFILHKINAELDFYFCSVFMKDGDSVVRTTFRIDKKDYPKQKTAIIQALKSAKLK